MTDLVYVVMAFSPYDCEPDFIAAVYLDKEAAIEDVSRYNNRLPEQRACVAKWELAYERLSKSLKVLHGHGMDDEDEKTALEETITILGKKPPTPRASHYEIYEVPLNEWGEWRDSI